MITDSLSPHFDYSCILSKEEIVDLIKRWKIENIEKNILQYSPDKHDPKDFFRYKLDLIDEKEFVKRTESNSNEDPSRMYFSTIMELKTAMEILSEVEDYDVCDAADHENDHALVAHKYGLPFMYTITSVGDSNEWFPGVYIVWYNVSPDLFANQYLETLSAPIELSHGDKNKIQLLLEVLEEETKQKVILPEVFHRKMRVF